MKKASSRLLAGLLTGAPLLIGGPALASSHMDAPLITLDDPANTTDVYAFVSEDQDGIRYLTTALAVYPFEEPGIGPNTYRFDDDVRYNIHVALDDDVARGRESLTYAFRFQTTFANRDTVLKAFLGPIESGPDCSVPAEQAFDPNQNLRQTYTVTLTERGRGERDLGSGVVPPNNQGLVTRYYNQGDNGEQPARGGVAAEDDLDRYTQGAICDLEGGHRAFAGQRDDGFYADIQSIFDLDFTFGGPNKPFDSQGGFNVHTIVLEIPLEELGGATSPASTRPPSGVGSPRSARARNGAGTGPMVRSSRSRGRATLCSARPWWRSAIPISTTGSSRARMTACSPTMRSTPSSRPCSACPIRTGRTWPTSSSRT